MCCLSCILSTALLSFYIIYTPKTTSSHRGSETDHKLKLAGPDMIEVFSQFTSVTCLYKNHNQTSIYCIICFLYQYQAC
ncbi:hypothetical protein OIU79_003149 [Salix purpurea]|uniref:Secreted protein n=1 Tax=Salix purpurea TaxID=77065 RepID=A0A9Q0ULD5_SALPP|nr:hypothetical protein OIU79_003149 [Salix purpurea]